MKKVIVICGPTASGKTFCAAGLARMIGGEVINADSMQVYRGMNIGTAKPEPHEMQGVPHHLIDIREPDGMFSVADYTILAKEKLKEIDRPVLCGGTGLYIDSVINNIDFGRYEIDYEMRAELDKLSDGELYEKLRDVDCESAVTIHRNNRRRVIRALEIYYTTGEKKSESDKKALEVKSEYDFIKFYLDFADRLKLYERINRRVDAMVSNGLFEEVEELVRRGYRQQILRIGTIGYKEVIEGGCNAGVVELIKKNTRNYAKRQITWFKRDINRINIGVTERELNDPELIIQKMEEYI